jgi:hypothetical protein
MKTQVKAYTGKPAPVSGQYRPSGGTSEYTFTRGEKTPPNREGVRQNFKLVDASKHKK